MILPLLFSLIALNLLQAKHFLVETEDKKENLDEENRLLDLLTEKQVSADIASSADYAGPQILGQEWNPCTREWRCRYRRGQRKCRYVCW